MKRVKPRLFKQRCVAWQGAGFHPNPALSGLARLAALGYASRSRCRWA